METGRTAPRVLPRPDVLGVVAVGGALGAAARYGLSVAVPHERGAFPWATFSVNVSGCLVMGALMVLLLEVWTGSRYLRPLLGVGVLGGFTTFSTFALETRDLLDAGHADVAGAYLVASVACALLALWLGLLGGRLLLAAAVALARRRRTRTPPGTVRPTSRRRR